MPDRLSWEDRRRLRVAADRMIRAEIALADRLCAAFGEELEATSKAVDALMERHERLLNALTPKVRGMERR